MKSYYLSPIMACPYLENQEEQLLFVPITPQMSMADCSRYNKARL